MVESPLPGVGVTHRQGDLTSHLRGRYPSVIAPTGSCARPRSSPRLGGSSVVEVVSLQPAANSRHLKTGYNALISARV